MAPARGLSTLAPTARGIDARAAGTRHNVVINGETYWIGIDGFLMPIAKDQPPPDLRHFQTKR